MNGYSAPMSSLSGIEKWSTVTRTMNKHKIAILAIQETHLDPSRLNDILSLFGHKVHIIASYDPDSPRASAGVAFAINKKLIKTNEFTSYELHKGRALALRIKWHEMETTLLNVYAPNNRREHPKFWENIENEQRTRRMRRPNFMLGDLNVTEDNIDRSPAHPDDPGAVSALRELRHKWELEDTWRHAHPNDRSFTYRASANNCQILSRLDRIYIARDTAQYTLNWKMTPTPTPTDHWLVMVKYAPGNAPHIGSGRWTWPIASLQNDKLMLKVTARGTQLQNDIDRIKQENTDRSISNPQTLWHEFKTNISTLTKQFTKDSYHKANSRINAITKDLK
ncbi:Endonuclease/exonuclease/phosphatase, partial [Russula emetica]